MALNIERNLIVKIKKYVKDKEWSLSELVKNLFILLSTDKLEIEPNHMTPRVKHLRRTVKGDIHFDIKNMLTEALIEKYDV